MHGTSMALAVVVPTKSASHSSQSRVTDILTEK